MSAPRLAEDWRSTLLALQPNWDTYGGKMISQAAIKTVGDFYVIPCGSGGIQFEFHQDGYDVEICIGPRGSVESVFVCHESKKDKTL